MSGKPPAGYIVLRWADPVNYKDGWAWASPSPRRGDTETEKESVEEAWEDIRKATVTSLLALDDEMRKAIFSEFCVHCGSIDPSCRCWDDE